MCGQGLFENYVATPSDYQTSKISKESTIASFTFGDGKPVTSLKKVKLSCWIGGLPANILTEVVKLLLSR